jgi:hypothetical protein
MSYMKKITAMIVSAVLLSAFTISTAVAQPPHIRLYYKVHGHYPPGYRADAYYTTKANLPPVPRFHHHDYWDGRPRVTVSFNTPQATVYHRRYRPYPEGYYRTTWYDRPRYYERPRVYASANWWY